MKKDSKCRHHEWIPFLGRVGKKNVPTAVFSCLNCGEMKVGIHTIRMSRFRLDMGNLPIKSVSEIVLQEAPAVDHTVSGTVVNMTYGESLVPGNVVYFKSDGCVWKADANAAGLYPAMGIALETYSSGSHKVLLEGVIRDDTWTWTVGGVVYLDIAAGGMTQTQPSAANDVIQVLGIATHADRMFFRPSFDYITHT